MGLLDKILRSGTRALGNALSDVVSDVVSDAVSDALGTNKKEVRSATRSVKRVANTLADLAESDNTSKGNTQYVEDDNRSFEEKFQTIMGSIGEYEIRKNISPDELEQEAGTRIYTRGGCYCEPDNLTYGIYKDGQRVLFVNLWDDYSSYKHTANREIKEYCEKNGTKVLDFFDYLPNEADYMEERIRKEFV